MAANRLFTILRTLFPQKAVRYGLSPRRDDPGPSISSHLRKDVLAYDSGVLESSLEIGRAGGKLYASSDAPDTDFVTMLLDVDERVLPGMFQTG